MCQNEEEKLCSDIWKALSSVFGVSGHEHHGFLAVEQRKEQKNLVKAEKVVIFQEIAFVYYVLNAWHGGREYTKVFQIHNDRLLQPREDLDTYLICSQGTLPSSQRIYCTSSAHASTISSNLPLLEWPYRKKERLKHRLY